MKRLLAVDFARSFPILRSFSFVLAALAVLTLAASPSLAKKPVAKKATAPKEAAPQTARAISELAGKFKWDISPDDAMKIVSDEITARFDERIKKETSPASQDKILRERNDAMAKMKDSYVKFDGQKTGWDVSLVDHEFAHKNNESMFVIWEKDQRRFLFFHNDKLWKQFIAFNAENTIFKDKTFDDFADLIQKRYGPAAMTFRKQRTSDDQLLDHLEWPPSGDYLLWAIDLTTLYGNFCLSVMKKSEVADVEKGRAENSPRRGGSNAVIESITKGDEVKSDVNADIVDEITGRASQVSDTPAADATPEKHSKKRSEAKKPATPKKSKPASADPLDGINL